MKQDNIIFETSGVKFSGTDQDVSRFNNLARDYFQTASGIEKDNLAVIKDGAKFFSFQLPPELNDFFISCYHAPLFWITDSPLLLFLEEFFKAHLSKGNGLDYHNDIKTFYSRWALINSNEEKKYFAISALKFLEKNVSKHNFYNTIVHAVILTWEDSLFNPDKALDLFDKAKDRVNSLKIGENKKDELFYIITLFCGFINLRQKKYEEAKLNFDNALTIKPSGISAVFHSAYSDIKLDNYTAAVASIREIFLYDLARISYSLDQNDISMFNYFTLNSVFANIFHYHEFSAVYEEINALISGKKNVEEAEVNNLKQQTRKFLQIKFEDSLACIAGGDVSLIDKLIKSFAGSKNVFFISSINKLETKFKKVVKAIETEIRRKHAAEIEARMDLFELEIKEKVAAAEVLKKEMEKFKIKIKEKLQDDVSEIERLMNSNIGILEDRIKHLHMVPKLDPVTAFKNTTTYNFILSIIVFLIGAFAGYSSASLGGSSDSNSLMVLIMTGGIKWALFSFLIGLVVAAIVSGSTVMERSNVKQRLLQSITILKTRKEQEIANLKEEIKRKELRTVVNFTKKINDLTGLVENFRKEKEKQCTEMQLAADEKIKEETEVLQAYL